MDLVAAYVIPEAMAVLGPAFDSPNARAMLLTIGLQESRFTHRAQVRGPARGFWQFERGGGVTAVLTHDSSKIPAFEALGRLFLTVPGEKVADTITRVHSALELHDCAAAVFARLLLWTLPSALPGPGQASMAWAQYLDAWRPGKPHQETWSAFYDEAWARVTQKASL